MPAPRRPELDQKPVKYGERDFSRAIVKLSQTLYRLHGQMRELIRIAPDMDVRADLKKLEKVLSRARNIAGRLEMDW